MIATILTVLVVGLWIAMEARASMPPPAPLKPEGDILAPYGRAPESPYRTPTPVGPEPTQAPAQVRPPKRGRWLKCPFCGSEHPGTKFEACTAVDALGCPHFGQTHVNQRCTSCGVALGSVFPSETVSGHPWRK